MERYLLDPSSPLTQSVLHANLHHNGPFPRHHFEPYQQWPTPDLTRHDSPDRTSISGNSSYATHTEALSPHQFPSGSYGSPEELAHTASPYHHHEQVKQESFGADFPSISLRDIEYEPEPEIIIEEVDATDMKMKIDTTYEPVHEYIPKVESSSKGYNNSPDSTLRDAESVQPMDPSEEESSDPDYTPQATRRRRSSASDRSYISSRQTQRRRSHHGRKNLLSPTTRVNKRTGRNSASATTGKLSGDTQHGDAQRHFPCPLAMYGCLSTFSSKNEWKRHVSTQHIKLGFWRCDLCATTIDPHDEQTFYHNDFNRKDLFTQHLRRMHAAPVNQSNRNQKEFPVNEDNIAEHQARCFRTLRETPSQSACLYCTETFAGPNSWENRMEHIGKHLEKDRRAGNVIADPACWNLDKNLERWLRDEGIIAYDKSGQWKIGDGRPRRGLTGEEGSESDSDV